MRRSGDRILVSWDGAAVPVSAACVLAGAGAAMGQCERFPTHVDYQQNTVGLAAADLDGDGDTDLIVGGTTLRLLINDGNGSFTTRAASSGAVSRVVAGDLDSDGDVDVVGVRNGALLVLLNNGAGVFSAPAPYGTQTPDALALADLDGDGDLDVAGVRDESVYIYRNRGDGTFDPPRAIETPGDNVWIVAADLNNDGAVDLATANASAAQVVILWNRGDGSFSSPQEHVLGGSHGACCIVSADFNGDGRMDLGLTCAADASLKAPARLRVLLNDEDGAFAEAGGADVPGFPQAVAIGDFDGDGDVDASVTTVMGQVTLVVVNRGDGTFDPGWTLSGRPYPILVIAADFDGDARVDLAVSANPPFPIGGYVSVFLNEACCRTDATGDGIVNSTDVSAFINLSFEDQVDGTLRADFNGDGVSNSSDVSEFIGAWFEEETSGCS